MDTSVAEEHIRNTLVVQDTSLCLSCVYINRTHQNHHLSSFISYPRHKNHTKSNQGPPTMKPTSLLLALAAAATTQISAAPGPLPSQVGARETFNPTLFLYGVDDDSDAYTLIVRTDNYSYPIGRYFRVLQSSYPYPFPSSPSRSCLVFEPS